MKAYILQSCVLSSLFFTGCATNPGTMAADDVKEIAAAELDCPMDKVQVKEVSNRWYTSGCSRKATFVCSGSNFMHKGTCIKESSK